LVLDGGDWEASCSSSFFLGETNPVLTNLKKKGGPDYKSHREVEPKIIIHSKQRENVFALSL
jgi:hypothetical protein